MTIELSAATPIMTAVAGVGVTVAIGGRESAAFGITKSIYAVNEHSDVDL